MLHFSPSHSNPLERACNAEEKLYMSATVKPKSQTRFEWFRGGHALRYIGKGPMRAIDLQALSIFLTMRNNDNLELMVFECRRSDTALHLTPLDLCPYLWA